MSAQWALLCVLGAPLVHALLVILLSRPPGLRDVVHVGSSLVVAFAAFRLASAAGQGEALRIVLAHPLPNVDLAFALEPLGALMAAVVAGLGVLHAIHTAGMARAAAERAPARLMAVIALTVGATMAVAFSANLFTLFVAYQALILTTFALIAHGGDEIARRAARTHLGTLLIASMGLLLPAMVWTNAVAGVEFRPGGLLAGRVDSNSANVLLVLFVLGMAMTAIPPLHRWLPASSVAPYPALAPIQALAVLPAGGIGLLKVTAYVFGPALRDAAHAVNLLLVLIGVSMCVAALTALSKQDMRERLAYSAMAQSLAAAMGALIALPQGAFAAALQMAALSCASATLLMVAGTVYAATGRRTAREYSGLGRVMPWTFAAFALAAASMIGLPPFSGAWAKLWLIIAAADAGLIWAAAMAGLAAALTFAHLGPLAAHALAARAPSDPFKRPDGASIMLVAPVILSAGATLWLLVAADPLAHFLAPIWTPPQ